MHEKYKKIYNMPPKIDRYRSNSNAVGIDFGTAECCAAVIRARGPDCVALDLYTAYRTMPSYIGYDEVETKCGQIVINRIRHFERCTSPEEVSSSLLKHIKVEVDKYQNKNLTEAVIAIPAAFTEKQKNALLKSAKFAGWKTIHYIPEPVAAAFAYSSEMDIPNHSKLLFFDFGGGTVDVCIVDIAADNLQMLSYDGDYYLGGRDFDALLYNHFDGILKHKHNIDVVKINKKYLLLQKCQEIKHTLSIYDNFW
uniref:Heat shock protein 70 n=1 Tax=Panagrolaimus sp. ES5 TaxID=591445 RepID=A0AC34FPC3_9BILA